MSLTVNFQLEKAPSAEEFLAKGPSGTDGGFSWPETFWNRDMIYDDHPTYRFPHPRPTDEELAADLETLASTDNPAYKYPEDFFSREVIYGDRD